VTGVRCIPRSSEQIKRKQKKRREEKNLPEKEEGQETLATAKKHNDNHRRSPEKESWIFRKRKLCEEGLLGGTEIRTDWETEASGELPRT